MKFQLEEDIILGKGARQIKLPSKNLELKDGQPLHVHGWGVAVKGKNFTRLKNLQDLLMYHIEHKKCLALFKKAKRKKLQVKPAWVKKDQSICAAAIEDHKTSHAKDSCAGDSGGPLVKTAKNGVRVLVKPAGLVHS